MVNSNTNKADDDQRQTTPDVKTVYFYREGDQRFAPVRMVVNPRKYRSMEVLMGELEDRIQLPRGVRNIFTPKGRQAITSIDEIHNGDSFLCSSHADAAKPVDMNNMLVEPRPFVAVKPKAKGAADESRFIRTGLPADEPSDEELNDVRSRIRRKQELRQLSRMEDEEKMRGKDARWAERVRRIILIRNGEPDVVKHYSLTTSTASNMFKVKADFSAMFGMPVERIYTVEGRLIIDVEDMFRSDSLAFIVSFGDHFKPMTGYVKYANLQEGELARMAASKDTEKAPKEKPRLNRYDTVVLPPMEKPVAPPKAPTFNEPPSKRPANLPPLVLSEKKAKGAPHTERAAPNALEVSPSMRLRSKTVVIDRERDKKVSFAGKSGKHSSEPPDDAKSFVIANGGKGGQASRRSRLSQHLANQDAKKLPVIVPSMAPPGKSKGPKQGSQEAVLMQPKKKRLQRSRSEVSIGGPTFAKSIDSTPLPVMKSLDISRTPRSNVMDPSVQLMKPSMHIARNRRNQERPQERERVPDRMQDRDRGQDKNTQLWEFRVTTGDLSAPISTSSIKITAYGELGKSPPIPFTPPKGAFMARAVEHFSARLPKIGDIYKIRLESTNSGPNPEWRCDTIVMVNPNTNEHLDFLCKRWLSDTRDDKQTVREMPALSEDRTVVPLINYDVIVHTGNLWNAGTHGIVSLEVYGDRGDTGRREMKNSNHNVPFVKGQVDVFPLECVSLGEVRFIKLRHDPGPSGSGWFVENVVLRVRELDLHSQFIFPISRWLNPHEDDGQFEIEVRPVDLSAYMRIQDSNMWPFERWKFTLPDAELMFYSCNSRKPLRITSGGCIDCRSELMDVADGFAVFTVHAVEDLGRENTVALRTTAVRSGSFVAFNQHQVVPKAEYSSICDLRIHVLPSRAVNLESEKFPNHFLSVVSNGQLHPQTENAMPGPAQAFFCYVKGAFRDGGTIMLCSSKCQTLCIEKDPTVLTALGKRNKLAHFRVHKVSPGNIRMFESIVFSGNYLQIRKGICNADGNGDRYCEFRVRRTREQNFVTLESVREKGCYVGFTNNGSVYPLIDPNTQNPHACLFTEIIEFGRRKAPPEKEPERQGGGKKGSQKQPEEVREGEEEGEEGPTSGSAPPQTGRPSGSEGRTQARRPTSKQSLVKRKPKKPSSGPRNRFDELSQPPPRIVRANRRPTPKKKKDGPPAPLPRVANMPPKPRVTKPPTPEEPPEEPEEPKKTGRVTELPRVAYLPPKHMREETPPPPPPEEKPTKPTELPRVAYMPHKGALPPRRGGQVEQQEEATPRPPPAKGGKQEQQDGKKKGGKQQEEGGKNNKKQQPGLKKEPTNVNAKGAKKEDDKKGQKKGVSFEDTNKKGGQKESEAEATEKKKGCSLM